MAKSDFMNQLVGSLATFTFLTAFFGAFTAFETAFPAVSLALMRVTFVESATFSSKINSLLLQTVKVNYTSTVVNRQYGVSYK